MKLRSLVVLVVSAMSLFALPAWADKAPPPRPPAPKLTPDVTSPADAGAAAPDAGAAAPDTEAPKAPEPVKRIEDTRPQRLPDGVFIGAFVGDGSAASMTQGAELRVTIVAGRVTEAFMRRPGGLPVFDLYPVESGDSIALRLQGATGNEFVRINGAFFDAERGVGRYDGVLGRHKTSGTWLLARR